MSNDEKVTRPEHYRGKTEVQALDLIETHDLNFAEGCIVKYVVRWKRTNGGIDDLKKARFYISRLIEQHEEKMEGQTTLNDDFSKAERREAEEEARREAAELLDDDDEGRLDGGGRVGDNDETVEVPENENGNPPVLRPTRVGKKNRCSHCGEMGHKKPSCPQNGKHRCGNCRRFGHNARTCHYTKRTAK